MMKAYMIGLSMFAGVVKVQRVLRSKILFESVTPDDYFELPVFSVFS